MARMPRARGRGKALGHVWSDGAEVDPERAGLCAVEQTVVPFGYLFHIGGIRQDSHDNIGGADRLGDRGGCSTPTLDEVLHLGHAAVVPDDVIAGFDQVHGHRAPHDSKSDDGDRALRFGHSESPSEAGAASQGHG